MDSGQTQTFDLAGMVEECQAVNLRLALVRADDAWQLRHGEITMHAAADTKARSWLYDEDVFLELAVAGAVAAGLLRAEPQEIGGIKVTAASPMTTCTFQRVAGHADWRPIRTPWPRTQWEISSTNNNSRQGGLLIGDGPSFVSYEAAFSAFFFGAAPSNQAGQQPQWRVFSLDRRAWLHRVTIAADAITVEVKGTASAGVVAELSTPLNRTVRTVGRTGRLRLRLPHGLADSSLLVLRDGASWIDYRYFHAPGVGVRSDESVVWHQPESELRILIAGGEGQYVEFKQEVPVTKESRRTVLKTIAAFASGGGGTLLFGVDDDAQLVGVDPADTDGLMLAVGNMIRDSIEPEPPYRLRVEELDGKTLIVVEVSASGSWHAINPVKPEFYVRRGASTPPARVHEIESGYTRNNTVLPRGF